MARRKRYYGRRYYSRPSIRRVYSRAKGGFKGILAPVLAGVADSVINPRSPIDGIGSTAIGFFMHNEIIKNLGLYQVGGSIASYLPFVGSGNKVGGNY
ncbi:MAG: hypothetical protein ACQXXF_07565 [Thermoplasmatota archaeon]|jgi:hypothetical protein